MCAWHVNGINLTTSPDNRGESWTQATIVVNNGPQDPLDSSQYNKACGNIDQTWLYRDSYQPSGPVWSLGGSGNKCQGYVDYSVASRSLDGGKSFSKVFQFPTAIYTPNITSTRHGTVAMFGCGISDSDLRPHLHYAAYNPDGSTTPFREADNSALPDCGKLLASQVPGSLLSYSPTTAGASWGGNSPDGQPDAIRVVYPVLSPGALPELPRQSLQVALYYLPRRGSSLPALSEAPLRIEALSSGGVIFRAGMLEPDATLQPGTARSGLIWWEEEAAPHTDGPGDFVTRYQTSYAVVSGRSTLSRVQALSLAAGTQTDFPVDLTSPTYPCGVGQPTCVWAGEYDRGAFFQPRGELPLAIPGYQQIGDWQDLGGRVFAGAPAAVSTGFGKVTVIGRRASDGQVFSKTYDGGWGTWKSLGGVATGGVGAASWGPGRLDVFVAGPNAHLWHYAEQGALPQGRPVWEALGGDP